SALSVTRLPFHAFVNVCRYRSWLRDLFHRRSTVLTSFFPAGVARPPLLSGRCFRTPQAMQCDLRKAIDTHCHDRGSDAYRGVTGHLVICPRARSELAWQNRVERDRNRSGETNLPAVGVATQHQIEASMRRLPINFRRV